MEIAVLLEFGHEDRYGTAGTYPTRNSAARLGGVPSEARRDGSSEEPLRLRLYLRLRAIALALRAKVASRHSLDGAATPANLGGELRFHLKFVINGEDTENFIGVNARDLLVHSVRNNTLQSDSAVINNDVDRWVRPQCIPR
jgi:hypothetical protein